MPQPVLREFPHILNVRVTNAQMKHVDEIAARIGEPRSVTLRMALRAGLKEIGSGR